MSIELVAALVGGIAAFLSALVSSIAQHSVSSDLLKKLASALVAEGPVTEHKDGLSIRIEEARGKLRNTSRVAVAHQVAGSLLTFSQFVIGALLTSAFVQQAFSKEIVGALGLLVIGSSAVRQHYRSDVQYVAAKRRAARLKSLIRRVEDELFARDEGLPDRMQPSELRQLISETLSQIEESEVGDSDAPRRPTKEPQQRLPEAKAAHTKHGA